MFENINRFIIFSLRYTCISKIIRLRHMPIIYSHNTSRFLIYIKKEIKLWYVFQYTYWKSVVCALLHNFSTWIPKLSNDISGGVSLGTLPQYRAQYCIELKKGKYNEGDEYLWRRSQLLRSRGSSARASCSCIGDSLKREREEEKCITSKYSRENTLGII